MHKPSKPCPNGDDLDNCPNIEGHAERRRWHLNRGISIENIIAILVLAGSFFVWATHQSDRIVILETKTKAMEEQLNRDRSEVRSDLKDIKIKVDEIAEAVASTRGKK